ncbi:hypothetical protein Lgor_0565 [Fluoribacter gormanii]|uniref:Uncharacterized protein n=1 Tax=Fluoribacter gormanii TaxID=464 RepID=A0A377GIV9_9GAMM|nr:hypothetical protein Lgor_0565 [Fluoribacter gormanii]SIR88846.1 hypothetical protein SAMN05421777_13620 [Fluoribacter gormanii]STO24779.1 Uncharacterised protein [Fluoribacter gormanii]
MLEMIIIPSALGHWPNSSDIKSTHLCNVHHLLGFKGQPAFYLISLVIITLRIQSLLRFACTAFVKDPS